MGKTGVVPLCPRPTLAGSIAIAALIGDAAKAVPSTRWQSHVNLLVNE
jgi:hypothetical protein